MAKAHSASSPAPASAIPTTEATPFRTRNETSYLPMRDIEAPAAVIFNPHASTVALLAALWSRSDSLAISLRCWSKVSESDTHASELAFSLLPLAQEVEALAEHLTKVLSHREAA